MGFLDTSKINVAFKKVVGKAHTDNAKEAGNESLSTFTQVDAAKTFGEAITPTPSAANLYDISGVVELVRLVATADPSANGHAFTLSLPADYQASSSNALAGTGTWLNGTELTSTVGAIQIVPVVYSNAYEAKPYTGGTGVKGSGALVAPGDVRDWTLDYANGVLFQENDPNTSPADITHIECYLYTGKMVVDLLGTNTGTIENLPISEIDALVNNALGTIDFVDTTDIQAVKWLVVGQDASKNMKTAEVFASSNGTLVSHQEYARTKLGAIDFDLDVDLNGTDMRLRVTTTDSIEVDCTRIIVKQSVTA